MIAKKHVLTDREIAYDFELYRMGDFFSLKEYAQYVDCMSNVKLGDQLEIFCNPYRETGRMDKCRNTVTLTIIAIDESNGNGGLFQRLWVGAKAKVGNLYRSPLGATPERKFLDGITPKVVADEYWTRYFCARPPLQGRVCRIIRGGASK